MRVRVIVGVKVRVRVRLRLRVRKVAAPSTKLASYRGDIREI